ncbi:DUF6683 family protein [Hymenobacter persicinus]|uniref:WG repeat-containing protein n=1 Tax=Hymenobacter persicinus TaxID=2025506 RepID=A0A4Q5LEN0_9BACT|nr:DUF6683 family protein [Hymenobacter persicinus]RYU78943.1 hypothetical protein EWM57_12225 [Hymenobacter persicinus]
MRIFLSCALLLAGLFSSTATHAQTQLGQPTLDEQKTQIWCATMKFVYGDTGRPNLQSTLRCGGSLKEFENSIKADSQKVYSMLYQPLEARGTMYKGLGSDKSRLQKLATEIINKLKASPARRKDAARMQGVQALEAQLKGYVENGTPPTDVATAVASDDQTDVIDTTATDEAVAGPAETGLGSQQIASAAPRAAGGESLMSKFFAPLALIMSLLSLFLYVMLRRSINDLGSRADRHRNELESVKASANGMPARPVAAAKGLTPELQRDIEKLVQQRVAEELGKRQQGSGQPQGQNQGKQNQPRPQGTQQSTPPRQAAPAAAAPSSQPQPQPQPRPQPVAAPPAPASVPAPVAAPESFQEAMPQPPVQPAGSPASTPRDEFESLIPPVQLPGTNWSEATAPAVPTPQPTPPAPSRYYVKVPVNGGFSDYDLQEQPQHDSIYEITPDPRVPERATFRVTANSGVHAYAIQSAQYSLRDACAYQQPNGPVSRIVTDKDGTLIKSNGAWQIEQKAAIHFE